MASTFFLFLTFHGPRPRPAPHPHPALGANLLERAGAKDPHLHAPPPQDRSREDGGRALAARRVCGEPGAASCGASESLAGGRWG